MFLSHVHLRRDLTTANIVAKLSAGNTYAAHQLLWELFPYDPDAGRDFLFRQENRQGWPAFFVVSEREPLAETALMDAEVKNYRPHLQIGDQLAFMLRANPIIARKAEGKKHSAKHDVWMNAKHEGQAKGLIEARLAAFIVERVKNWLIERGAQAGFSLSHESVEIGGYQQHRIYKKQASSPIRYSSVDFQGVLTVQDPLRMENMLFSGIGRSKSFGCGLMLVRRI